MTDKIIVTASDDQLESMDVLAERLRAAGMRVDQVLHPLGLITGAVAEDERAAVADVPGVEAVEDETSYQLPPPDSDIL